MDGAGQVDERSSTDIVRPAYDGEDRRATSKRELLGWYSYAWAAEVFVVCGVGSMVPITLEQLARENGVLLADHRTPCVSALPHPLPPGSQPPPTSPNEPIDAGQCVVSILGVEINTASFAMYSFSISVFMQAILIISMSGAADHGRYRKTFLLSFAAIGSIATMLFIFATPSVFGLGALLAIISNTCFGASSVLLNSFLPLLVRYHPDNAAAALQQGARSDTLMSSDHNNHHANTGDEYDDAQEHDTAHSTDALLPATVIHSASAKPQTKAAGSRADPLKMSPALALSSKISANGLSIGYVAAIIMQLLIVIIISSLHGSLWSLRLVLFLIGAWWAIFTIPSALFLRPRPGPPLDSLHSSAVLSTSSNRHPRTKRGTLWLYITLGWRTLWITLHRATQLRDALLFLLAWFLLSDAIATVSGTAILFAKIELHMGAASLASINLVVMIFGILGAMCWPRVALHYRMSPVKTIVSCLCLFEIIPIYALTPYILGVFLGGPRNVPFGLVRPWEVFPVAAVYGLVLGGLGSYCRAVFGELVPVGAEASFYALYAITDKGSSVFGPTVVGVISDATGDIRLAFWFLAVLIAAPMPFIACVDVVRGKEDGGKMGREIGGLGEGRED